MMAGRSKLNRERSFGLSVGGVLIVIALALLWRGRIARAEVIGAVGVTLVVLGWLRPTWLKRPSDAWWAMATSSRVDQRAHSAVDRLFPRADAHRVPDARARPRPDGAPSPRVPRLDAVRPSLSRHEALRSHVLRDFMAKSRVLGELFQFLRQEKSPGSFRSSSSSRCSVS